MTNNLQPLYDILGEAFKAGMKFQPAGDTLFPLAARMEEEIKKLVGYETEECAKEVAGHWNDMYAMTNQKQQAERSAAAIRRRSLPSSPERET